MNDEAGLPREQRLAQRLIRALDLADLIPGRRHQLLLLLANDLRPDAGGDAIPRIEIQRAKPRAIASDVTRYRIRNRTLQRVPSAIQRRRQNR